jgi:hypothetical protein
MSKVKAIWLLVREPWRTSVLAEDGVGVGMAVTFGVGLAVGSGVRRGVGSAVGRGVCPDDGVTVARGVGRLLGAGTDGDGLEAGEPVMVGAGVGRNAFDGIGETDAGAADPQLARTSAAASVSPVMER